MKRQQRGGDLLSLDTTEGGERSAPVGSAVASEPPGDSAPNGSDAVINAAGLRQSDLAAIERRAAEAREQEDNFKWEPENEDVVVAEQRATAVYMNPWKQAVIRQEAAWNDESDTFICLSLEAIPGVIEKLRGVSDSILAERASKAKERGRK